MATSSITKNFVISGQKQVEMFADVTYLQGADEIIKFMEKRKKTDAADE